MNLILHPNEILTTPTNLVTSFANLKEITNQMLDIMYMNHGIGLAAPQVGLGINLFVMNPTGNYKDHKSEMIFVNVKNVEYLGDTIIRKEGCLSLPGIHKEMTRFEKIKFDYQTISGKKKQINLSGIESIVCQHEYDHLCGKLIIS
jgi:peptide deformylase